MDNGHGNVVSRCLSDMLGSKYSTQTSPIPLDYLTLVWNVFRYLTEPSPAPSALPCWDISWDIHASLSQLTSSDYHRRESWESVIRTASYELLADWPDQLKQQLLNKMLVAGTRIIRFNLSGFSPQLPSVLWLMHMPSCLLLSQKCFS